MNNCEREAGGNSGVDGVAARAHGFDANLGGERVRADDHPVFGAEGF